MQLVESRQRGAGKFSNRVATQINTQFKWQLAVLDGIPQRRFGFLRRVCRCCRYRPTPEIKVAFERCRLPWHLLALRISAHIGTHPLEHILNLAARLADRRQQMLRIQAIGAAAVACNRTRRSGIGHQSPHRCVHLGQTGLAGTGAARKRVVAAGIQNHDVGNIAGCFHLVEHGLGVNCAVGNLIFPINTGTDRNQIIAAFDLHAMSGVIEQAGTTRTQFVAKLAQRRQHGALVNVFPGNHSKPGLLQSQGDGMGVIDRIGQRPFLVSTITDHQGNALGVVNAGLHHRLHLQVALIGRSGWDACRSRLRQACWYRHAAHQHNRQCDWLVNSPA